MTIKDSFKKLYAFRSNLVHGNADIIDNEIFAGHLQEARNMARESLLWFLKFLEQVQKHYPQDIGNLGLPERKELLYLIDTDLGSRERLKVLLDKLPKNFPKL